MSMMPKPDDRAKELFRAVMPQDPRVQTRPMFGNLAGFVNGNMFTGLFGNDVFVRLGEDDRSVLLREQGAHMLEPMAGHLMREYVVLPEAWKTQPERMRQWVQRAMTWTSTLPSKAPKEAKAGRKR